MRGHRAIRLTHYNTERDTEARTRRISISLSFKLGEQTGATKICLYLLRRLIWNYYYYISNGNFVNFFFVLFFLTRDPSTEDYFNLESLFLWGNKEAEDRRTKKEKLLLVFLLVKSFTFAVASRETFLEKTTSPCLFEPDRDQWNFHCLLKGCQHNGTHVSAPGCLLSTHLPGKCYRCPPDRMLPKASLTILASVGYC